jgi:hypothetical protein
MSVGTILNVMLPVKGTWDTWHSVKIRNEVETIAMLNRVLSKRGILTGYESVALADAIFHFKAGWARVDGGWAHWSHSEADGQIQLAFLNDLKDE